MWRADILKFKGYFKFLLIFVEPSELQAIIQNEKKKMNNYLTLTKTIDKI